MEKVIAGQELIELKIGDILYENNRFGGLRKLTIIRTTPKQAVANDDTRFDIIQKESRFIKAKGHSSSYTSSFYYMETQELKDKYIHQQLVRKFETIKPKELSTIKLQKILSIITEE